MTKRHLFAIPFLLASSFGSARAQLAPSPGMEPRLASQSSNPAPSLGAAAAPRSADPFVGSVPSGAATSEEIGLTLPEAIGRALKNNLGLLLSDQSSRVAAGNWWKERSALLPNVTTRTTETVQQTNLRAYGFTPFPGNPTIIGPFSVFDSRVTATQSLLDLPAWRRTSAAAAGSEAADFDYQDARERVVWMVANLYFKATAGGSRVDVARSQLHTAEALFRQATDFKDAGTVPVIEVLRAQVEMQTQQQRVIYFENELEKEKLDLARAIGLPVRQKFRLTEPLSDQSPAPIQLADALQQAYLARKDFQSLEAEVRAAELRKRAAESERLPKLTARTDYGDIGRAPGVSHGTFSASASLEFPLFQGGRIHGNVLQADADLAQRKAELENLRAGIEYELEVALLDLESAERQVQVARSARELAAQQLTQAQDRFAAGVASNIEVVEAQESLAAANENYISGLYFLNAARVSFERAMGSGQQQLPEAQQGETR